MSPATDLLRVGAGENLDQVGLTDGELAGLPDAVDARQELVRRHRAVVGCARLEAVVAGAAVIEGELLAEIVQQLGPPAPRALGVVHDLAQLGPRDLLLLRVGHLVEEMRLLRDVARAEQQQAVARQPVAPGPAGLLVVALDVFRQVVVDDPAHIGFVDAHAEGDGCADDAGVVAQEALLVPGALLGAESGVVGPGRKAAAGQRLGQALRGGAAGAVDDAALVLAAADEVDELFQRLVLGRDPVREVGSVEARDKRGGIPQLEVGDDVGADALGGRGRQRHERHVRQRRPQPGELTVLGPEVVAPFRDAVRLVDGQATDFPAFEVLLPALEHEPLGRGVEELVFALVQAAQAAPGFVGVEARVEKRGRHAAGGELVHLVLHQRDERRHDDR